MQSVNHLDSASQFCMVLLCDDGNNGLDFCDLPGVDGRKGKGPITGEMECKPLLTFRFLD